MSVAFNLRQCSCKVKKLQRLPEAFGRSSCNLPAVISHGKQLVFPFDIVFLCSFAASQLLVSPYIFLRCFVTYDYCFIKLFFNCKIRILTVKLCKTCFGPFYHTVKALFQKSFIVHYKMSYAAVVIQVGLKNLLADLRTFNHILVHIRIGKVLNGFALPVIAKLNKFFSVLFTCKIVLIMLTLLERFVQRLVQHPVN